MSGDANNGLNTKLIELRTGKRNHVDLQNIADGAATLRDTAHALRAFANELDRWVQEGYDLVYPVTSGLSEVIKRV